MPAPIVDPMPRNMRSMGPSDRLSAWLAASSHIWSTGFRTRRFPDRIVPIMRTPIDEACLREEIPAGLADDRSRRLCPPSGSLGTMAACAGARGRNGKMELPTNGRRGARHRLYLPCPDPPHSRAVQVPLPCQLLSGLARIGFFYRD